VVIAEFNSRLAAETEQLHLDPTVLKRGVTALLKDRSKGIYYIAEMNGAVVGQLMITYEWSDWRNGNIWWLQSVYVEKNARRKGVFAALFEHLKSVAVSKRAVWGLRLYMHARNDRARRTYKGLGMTATQYYVYEMNLREQPKSQSKKTPASSTSR
jgi:GNAT superfamily N-acetyltransferase